MSLSRPLSRVERRACLMMVLSAFASVDAWAEISYLTLAKHEEAKLLMARGENEQAVELLRAVLREAPMLSSAAIDLSKSLFELGRRKDALAELLAAAEREKGARREVLLRRHHVLSRTFLKSANFQAFQEAIGMLFAKKYPQARERIEQVAEKEPDHGEVLLRLGQAEFLAGDPRSAEETFRRAKALDPHEPLNSLWLGRVLHLQGNVVPGIEELRSAQKRFKASEVTTLWLADALIANGQRNVALQLLDQDFKANPLHLHALLMGARLRLQAPARDPQVLWSVRKDLQLGLSRLEDFQANLLENPRDGIGMEWQTPASLRAEMQTMIEAADMRLSQRGDS